MKQRPLKVAVVSDNHIDTEVEPDSWELAKTAFKKVAAAKVDHVIIAGDLFDHAGSMVDDCETVSNYLRKLGLWHRDRLTVIVGNHDIFRTPHRGGRLHQAAQIAKAIAFQDAQEMYDTFCEWAGELARPVDRLAGDDDLFPIEKNLGHVCLWAVDTTGVDTPSSSNGRWSKDDDKILRARGAAPGARRVLAMHNAPEKSAKQSVLKHGLNPPLGFPGKHFRRLEEFVSDLDVHAVVCGHMHDPGDDEYEWEIGNGTRAFLVGRSGGMHDTEPCLGLLEVPASNGRLKWKTVRV